MENIKLNIPKIIAYKYLPAIISFLRIGSIPYNFSQLFFSVIENGNPLKDTQKNMIIKTGIMG
jgi:hypothetical protein